MCERLPKTAGGARDAAFPARQEIFFAEQGNFRSKE
jgi:hypothetical protein